MKYDDDTIERVKEASDIVNVIGGHLALKRSGSSFKALCPFHQEKTPSFMVNPARQVFHCFGCDTGGDVIRFVMLYEGLPFVESLKKLAVQAGIELPESAIGAGTNREKKDPLYTANRIAAEYYSGLLMKEEEGQKARQYLKDRGIHSDVSRTFGIGYAPPGWRNVADLLKENRIGTDTGVSAGLLVQGEEGKGPYDRFRDRVVFSIRDLSGRVLGFGGRVFGDEMPKYVNTPETPVYRKGDSLFGLDVAAPHVREAGEVILVEGYLDVIALHQGGIRNVVGVLGTAFTEDQAKRVRRLTDRCVVLFDSDEAGRRAALRSGMILLTEQFSCRVAPLDSGEDPDSFLRKHGTEALSARIAEAPDVILYALDQSRKELGADTMSGRFQVIDAIVPFLAKIRDRARLGAYLKEVGDALRIEQHDLRARLASLKGRVRDEAVSGDPPISLHRRDRLLLHILIREPDTVPRVREVLRAENMKSPEAAEMVDKIFSGVNLTTLLDTVNDKWKDLLSRWALEDPLEGTEKALDDLLLQHAREKLEEKIRQTRDRLTEAVRRGANQESRELNEEWKRLQTELRLLKTGGGLQPAPGANSSGGESQE
ncbi:MAG: DNA primase [bacterium]|nr:DNA primase [bacterium]MDT8395119.1 DNA primase [bacterium]